MVRLDLSSPVGLCPRSAKWTTPTINSRSSVPLTKFQEFLLNPNPTFPKGVNPLVSVVRDQNYQREYVKYYEGSNHGAYTHERYDFGAYGRNDYNDPLMSSGVLVDPSCYGSGAFNDASLVEPNVVDRESQEAKDLLHGPLTSARPKKIKDNDGNVDNGMDLKSNKRLLSCSQFVQLAMINYGNKKSNTVDDSPTPTVAISFCV
ncbi:hypothetical protein M9H77_18840 [Catharanthus roseus]|uniref:Uncharacterized protein n=1 Tax=Catharanthus roseus TaxID=4058 RepID=A0ACC0B8J5_CATRO|nr:hypothetical protein M9H77_18840 [Catharanthus roseus]